MWRAENISTISTIMEWQPRGKRRRGRLTSRWQDDVDEDLRTVGVRHWQKKAEKRNEWRGMAEYFQDTNTSQ